MPWGFLLRVECPLLAHSGHELVRCIRLLLTQSGHALFPPFSIIGGIATMTLVNGQGQR